MSTSVLLNPSRGDSADPPSALLSTVADLSIMMTTRRSNISFYGPRGDTWQTCTDWFEAMPGSFFQLANLFLLICFMAGGSSEVAAIYIHFTGILAFATFAIWGYLDACSWDILGWAIILCAVNLIQLIITCQRSKRIQKIMGKDGMGHLHASRFQLFGISPQLFVELVTCKGCEITHMEAGQSYAVEGTTPAHRLSLILSGRMKVLYKGKFLHYVVADSFIDSAEWFAANDMASLPLFKVSIASDTDCTFISWKRKGLLAVLAKHKRLGKLFNIMLGKDVACKLHSLNDRCINERGFRYDIRLPCVMSLPKEVERRQKAATAPHSAPGTPGMEDGRKHRQKRLGKTAAAKYAKMFANKLRARVSMRAAKRPLVPMRREPLKEED